MVKLWNRNALLKKLKKRMPGGILYESIKEQKKRILNEENPEFKRLMSVIYKRTKDVYFRGGKQRYCKFT